MIPMKYHQDIALRTIRTYVELLLLIIIINDTINDTIIINDSLFLLL